MELSKNWATPLISFKSEGYNEDEKEVRILVGK